MKNEYKKIHTTLKEEIQITYLYFQIHKYVFSKTYEKKQKERKVKYPFSFSNDKLSMFMKV